MSREEIKTDIETEKLYLEDCETTVKVVREHLAALEAQLAEVEKPELRHGDCVVYNDTGRPQVFMERKGLLEHFGCNFGSGHVAKNVTDFTFSYNIFDDLKALAEPLKEFKIMDEQSERTVQFVGSPGNLYIELAGTDGERVRNINIPSSKAILNLRRLVYTAEQEAAK